MLWMTFIFPSPTALFTINFCTTANRFSRLR
jgi:hypothetical protein